MKKMKKQNKKNSTSVRVLLLMRNLIMGCMILIIFFVCFYYIGFYIGGGESFVICHLQDIGQDGNIFCENYVDWVSERLFLSFVGFGTILIVGIFFYFLLKILQWCWELTE